MFSECQSSQLQCSTHSLHFSFVFPSSSQFSRETNGRGVKKKEI